MDSKERMALAKSLIAETRKICETLQDLEPGFVSLTWWPDGHTSIFITDPEKNTILDAFSCGKNEQVHA